ncbi:hypothetical protein [Clostridium guangxiense]|uniref:hypothetical protein n=1 Tax=Clostridium guangxiense TaxID=1662055 RepID=UPI001E43B5BB|nr:hypothetical protein [Clostridium guangxiense]MCD2348714.1 hypothetical protein [Clostridium guangxiense]
MNTSSYVLIASIMTSIVYVNHIFIIKKIKEDKNILVNVILGVILVFILSSIVYDICSRY